MTSSRIRDLGERHWNGQGDLVHAHHPVMPVEGRMAEELLDGVLYVKSVASITALDSGDGLVMLDTGGPFDAQHIYDVVRAWRPGDQGRGRLRAAVFSHHHIDHVFGTRLFESESEAEGWAAPAIHGHEAMPADFRRYERTRGWNTAINQRQFGLPVAGWEFPGEFRDPTVTYREESTFRCGELTFELHHGLGETDDATWTWVPERRLLHPGDLFIWAIPNAGNPQKVQRYAGEWATALRQMAALGAEIMLPGHGLPVFGADRIRQALRDTAEVLDSIEAQTLELMNTGCTLDRAIHEVTLPAHLLDRPYLRPVYDHPQFLVRNVWRRFGGWYDGQPDNLLPAPRHQQAEEWVALAGGIVRVLGRARELAAAGDHRMACHLVEHAVLADPESADAHTARAEIYAAWADQQESSMARNILRHAAISSEQGRLDLAGGR
jgi:alkyl sulfatase BDS1-like metallo-beta-lactamase superfamily hydrolase